jgi:hypothetical protein
VSLKDLSTGALPLLEAGLERLGAVDFAAFQGLLVRT